MTAKSSSRGSAAASEEICVFIIQLHFVEYK